MSAKTSDTALKTTRKPPRTPRAVLALSVAATLKETRFSTP
jgi:hypothetical protein